MEPITLEFTYSKEDYVQAMRRFLRLTKTISRLSLYFLAVAAVADVIFLAMFGLTIENLILTVMLVCCGVMLLIFHYQPARTYDKSPRLKAVQHYEFSPEGITMKTASATSQVKWNLFSYYWDDVTGVYLLQNKKSYILLPARLFSSDDQRQALQQMAVEGNPDIQYKDFRLTRV